MAAIGGHLHVVDWLDGRCASCGSVMVEHAAKHGQLHILQWWSNTRGRAFFSKNAGYYAAENGHLEVVRYLFENGAPFDETTCASAAKKVTLSSCNI